MKLIYFGPLWDGSTALHRAEALNALSVVEVRLVDESLGAAPARLPPYARLRWKLRIPIDRTQGNERLLEAVRDFRPDAVIIDSSQIITARTLITLRQIGCRCLAYYSPDDAVAQHSVSRELASAFGEWDVFFTTKSFNVAELRARGVRNPVLIGNSFDPGHHRPLTPDEVGADFERYDAVFIGAWEAERCRSINYLAASGISVGVFGPLEAWRTGGLDPSIALFPPALGDDYARAMHMGKLALCFLRKASRDRITTRSVEIPAMARPMLAEQSDEHDEAFMPDVEYLPFASDDELISKALGVLQNDPRRQALALSGYQRCRDSDYSTSGRARDMAAAISQCLEAAREDS